MTFKGHKIARLFDRAQRPVTLGEERFKLRGRDLVLALNARYGGDARLFGIVIPRFIAAAGAADAAARAGGPGAEIDLRNGKTLHAFFPEQRRVRQRDEKFPLDLKRETGFTHK